MGYPKNDRCTSFFGISQDYLSKRFVWDIPKPGTFCKDGISQNIQSLGYPKNIYREGFGGGFGLGKRKGERF